MLKFIANKNLNIISQYFNKKLTFLTQMLNDFNNYIENFLYICIVEKIKNKFNQFNY